MSTPEPLVSSRQGRYLVYYRQIPGFFIDGSGSPNPTYEKVKLVELFPGPCDVSLYQRLRLWFKRRIYYYKFKPVGM